MKLLYTLTSPYARKVRIFAIEKQLDVEFQTVVLTDLNCPVKHHNPLGKVPVLIVNDDHSLYDSRVIVEYLDDCNSKFPLIPHDSLAKISVRRCEALADGICDAAVAVVLERRKPTQTQDQKMLVKQMDKVTRGLTSLEHNLSGRIWCVNDTFSLADIAVGCVLGYIHLRFDQSMLTHLPNLQKLYANLIQRPSFIETMPNK